MQEEFPVSLFDSETVYHIPEFEGVLSLDLNAKELLVLLPANSLSEELKQQIEKIFSACKVPADSIFISDKIIPWSKIQEAESLKNVVLFGVNPKALGVFYHLYSYHFLEISGKHILLADELKLILENPSLKADFWHKCLKLHFMI